MICAVELTRATTTVAWLCSKHQEKRVGDGFVVKILRPLGHHVRCDDCPMPRGPDRVDYIPTSRGARLPTEAEHPRERPGSRAGDGLLKKAGL